MTARPYTHALTLQLPDVPEGYMPLGTEKTLRALYDVHAAGQKGPVEFYALTRTPDFATWKINEDVICQRLQAIARGDLDVSFSTRDIVTQVRGVTDPLNETVKSVAGLLKKVRADGKINAIEALPTILQGQAIYARARTLQKELTGEFDRALYHTQTENYLRNDKGVFVTRDWLADRENAKRVMTCKPQPAPQTPAQG